MKLRIGLIGNIPLVIGDEHEVTSNEILVELSKTDPNKIDIKRRINGKLKALTSGKGKDRIIYLEKLKPEKIYLHIPKFYVHDSNLKDVLNDNNVKYPRYTGRTRDHLNEIVDDCLNASKKIGNIDLEGALEYPVFVEELNMGINIISLRELFRGTLYYDLYIERPNQNGLEYNLYQRYYDLEYNVSSVTLYVLNDNGTFPGIILLLKTSTGNLSLSIELLGKDIPQNMEHPYIIVYIDKYNNLIYNNGKPYFYSIEDLDNYFILLGVKENCIINSGKVRNIYNSRIYKKRLTEFFTYGESEYLISDVKEVIFPASSNSRFVGLKYIIKYTGGNNLTTIRRNNPLNRIVSLLYHNNYIDSKDYRETKSLGIQTHYYNIDIVAAIHQENFNN